MADEGGVMGAEEEGPGGEHADEDEGNEEPAEHLQFFKEGKDQIDEKEGIEPAAQGDEDEVEIDGVLVGEGQFESDLCALPTDDRIGIVRRGGDGGEEEGGGKDAEAEDADGPDCER